MLKIYKFDEAVFYVHKSGYGIRINGITVKDGTAFSKIETVQRITSSGRKKILLDDEEITQEKYQELEREFFTLIYDDDSECELKEYCYKGASEDYEKFKDRIKSEWVTTETNEDVEYEIIEAPKIPEKFLNFITPCEMDGIETFSLIRSRRPEFAKSVFASECKKFGVSYDIPNHSGLRFAKIEGDYVFDESFDIKSSSYPQKLEEAITDLNRIELNILEKVKIYSLKKTAVKEKNVYDVINFLEKLRGEINSLSVKKDSSLDKGLIFKRTTEFLNDFKRTYITDEN
jgi:hypothetical protein